MQLEVSRPRRREPNHFSNILYDEIDSVPAEDWRSGSGVSFETNSNKAQSNPKARPTSAKNGAALRSGSPNKTAN